MTELELVASTITVLGTAGTTAFIWWIILMAFKACMMLIGWLAFFRLLGKGVDIIKESCKLT